MEIIDDLVAEQERLDAVLAGLTEEQWLTESAAPGWTVADVVLHLAQSEELVIAAAADPGGSNAWARGTGMDATADEFVKADRAAPEVVLQRWRTSRRTAVEALRTADPATPLPWVATSIKPRTLATTRLAEHWAHGIDVTEPLGLPWPDTDRLRHVAWLAVSTLPYAFAVAGQEPAPVRAELTSPDGTSTWTFGPPDAASAVTGPVGAFCRVGAQRLKPADSGLVTTGPDGARALSVLRTYAA